MVLGDALHDKSATSGPEVVMDPNLALNGNRDPSGSCAISRSQDGSAAWWQVDMGDSFLVMSVTVTSSTDRECNGVSDDGGGIGGGGVGCM